MTFALEFIDRRKKRARIRADAFLEEFTVCGGATTYDYERLWRFELETLLRRKKKVALPFAGSPGAVSRAWIFYRIGDQAKIQERLFLRGFNPSRSRLPPRETVTDDGQRISEWSVDISAIEAFLGKKPNLAPQTTRAFVPRV